jgi:hypothetical protein
MTARIASSSAAPAAAVDSARWVAEAQQRYGLDQRTAQRFAFYRWLHATGRLTDG